MDAGFIKSRRSEVRKAAKRALTQILEPLAGFVLDAGLGISEVNAQFREAAVRSAAAKQLACSERINISGIAAITGISRADISRILKAAPSSDTDDFGRQESTNRILAAWYVNPKFTDPDGQPAELQLYGTGATFETLARKYGNGIPTRAILDELIRSGAVEITAAQMLRVNSTVTIQGRTNARQLKAFGDRASELLSTLLSNIRQPEVPKLVANVSLSSVSPASLPMIRKELKIKATEFLHETQRSLKRYPIAGQSKMTPDEAVLVSVTIFLHETAGAYPKPTHAAAKRRYFHRQ